MTGWVKDVIQHCEDRRRAHAALIDRSEHRRRLLGLAAMALGVGVGVIVLAGAVPDATRFALPALAIAAGLLAMLQVLALDAERVARTAVHDYAALSAELRDPSHPSPESVRGHIKEIEGRGRSARQWQQAAAVFPILLITGLAAGPDLLVVWGVRADSMPASGADGLSDGGARSAQPAAPARPAVALSERERTIEWFEKIRHRPPLLRAFLQAMPKGADLHNHLSGAVHAEDLLRLGAAAGLCVQPDTMKAIDCADLAKEASAPPPATLAGVLRDPAAYDRVVDAWSLRGAAVPMAAGHDAFFATFGLFGNATRNHEVELMVAAARDAIADNTGYVEWMMTWHHACELQLRKLLQGQSGELDADCRPDPKQSPTATIAEIRAALTAFGDQPAEAQFGAAGEKLKPLLEFWAKGPKYAVENGERKADWVLATLAEKREEAARQLQCPKGRPDDCPVIWRFIQQISRRDALPDVFVQIAWAFELASGGGPIVGLNMVTQEDGRTAREDYRSHMAMLGWFKSQAPYPEVPIALHAGELTLGLVPPVDLRFHIRAAVADGMARRIGHGVSLGYENDALGLLTLLRDKDVAIEINLSSNERILGIGGAAHPFPIYRAFGVPVVISTDDAGVSRSDLTHEYQLAAERYDLTYPELKKLASESVRRSFGGQELRDTLEQRLHDAFAAFERTDWPLDRLP